MVRIQKFHLQPEKKSKTNTTTAGKDHLLLCDHEDSKTLASSNSVLLLKMKENLLISRDKPEFKQE